MLRPRLLRHSGSTLRLGSENSASSRNVLTTLISEIIRETPVRAKPREPLRQPCITELVEQRLRWMAAAADTPK